MFSFRLDNGIVFIEGIDHKRDSNLEEVAVVESVIVEVYQSRCF